MRTDKALMLLWICVLSGCAYTTDRSQVDWITPEGYDVFEHNLNPNAKRNQRSQQVFDSSFKSFDEWVQAAIGGSENRDGAQFKLISLSNDVCERHLAGIHGHSSTINLGLNIATLALAGASSVVKPKRPAQSYGALAALTSGSRSAFNADLFYNMMAPAVIAKIRALRADAFTKMANRRAETNYGAAEAVNDALRYHSLCSMYIGIQGLTEDAGLRKQVDISTTPTQRVDALKASIAKVNLDVKSREASLLLSPSQPLKIRLEREKSAFEAQRTAQWDELMLACIGIGEKINAKKDDCEAP